MAVFLRRGWWFCRAVLHEVGVAVLNPEEWHDRVVKFPKTLMYVCSDTAIYAEIGELAQDSLIGLLIDESASHPSVLTNLEKLSNDGALSERQQVRFEEHISDVARGTILVSGLGTRTCYEKLIECLMSHNWYVQNPAIEMIESNGPQQLAELTQDQQTNLGRNILQAAEGTASNAIQFLENPTESPASWPSGVVQGIVLESFTNESDEIRFKDYNLEMVLSALDQLEGTPRDELIERVVESIDRGRPRGWINQRQVNPVIAKLNIYGWAERIVIALNPNPPKGVVEMAEQGIRDPEERLSR